MLFNKIRIQEKKIRMNNYVKKKIEIDVEH